MTDEQIFKAAEEYFSKRDCHFGLKDLETFVVAAKWALSNQWIDVKDELPVPDDDGVSPDCFVRYLAMDRPIYSYGYIMDNYKWGVEWYVEGYGCINDVTHWMPIPKLKEE